MTAIAKPPRISVAKILLVDDEIQFLRSASLALRMAGYEGVEVLSDSEAVLPLLEKQAFDLVVLDLNMPGRDGRDLLTAITERHPQVTVCMLTAVNEVEAAVNCMRAGAFDYWVKPVTEQQMLASLSRALDHRLLLGEAAALKQGILRQELSHPESFAAFITQSPTMQRLFLYVEAVARTSFPILVAGETGTGKELMAKAIHLASDRRGAFVVANAAGIDDGVFADTLFGHARGAFTGADRDRKGLIEEAAGGTLFLDEIGDLSAASQVKLLRLLQDGSFHPIGSDKAKRSTARIIVATHRDLASAVREGRFRQDLFFRLQTHEVHIPPLRDRLEDLPLLAKAFVAEAAKECDKPMPYLPPELHPLLATYSYPGNVRELQGLLFDAVSRNTTRILGLGPLRDKLAERRQAVGYAADLGGGPAAPVGDKNEETGEAWRFPEVLPTAQEWERLLVNEAVRRAQGNRSLAASLIGLARQTVIKRLKENETLLSE